MNYDIAIIGGGPAGYTAAERAAEGGLKTVLFEKNAIGGVCLNEGCIPTKTLLYSAKILDSFKTSSKYGISPEGTPSFDMDKIIRRKNRTVKKLTSGVKMRLTSSGITIVEGTAVLNGETDGMIRIQCGNDLFTVKNVLLCTGSETVIPPIKGLSDTDYWTSREALDSKELPKELAIIGGGVIAETQIVDVDIAGDSGLAVRKHTQRSDADLEAAVIGIVGQCVNCRAPSSGQCNGLGEGVPFWRAVLV